MNQKFEKLCKMTQKEIKNYLLKKLYAKYSDVVEDDGYLFAKGDVPILLVAHMDTVHLQVPETFIYNVDEDIISSPQGIGGDDRCGIYMILEIIKKHKCSVLFTEDEEIGGIGAHKFARESFIDDLGFNYIIELDRMGSDDAVFYDCDNYDFEDFITADGDWKTDFGSFSDICIVAPALGCAAVNLSCGYYNAHTAGEYVVLSEMKNNIKKVCKLIERTTEKDKFEYIEAKYRNSNKFYFDDDQDFLWGMYVITFVNDKGRTDFEEIYARSRWEAIGMFLDEYSNLTASDIDVDFYGYDESYM